jgi:hypothetical protein
MLENLSLQREVFTRFLWGTKEMADAVGVCRPDEKYGHVPFVIRCYQEGIIKNMNGSQGNAQVTFDVVRLKAYLEDLAKFQDPKNTDRSKVRFERFKFEVLPVVKEEEPAPTSRFVM